MNGASRGVAAAYKDARGRRGPRRARLPVVWSVVCPGAARARVWEGRVRRQAAPSGVPAGRGSPKFLRPLLLATCQVPAAASVSVSPPHHERVAHVHSYTTQTFVDSSIWKPKKNLCTAATAQ
jgi:hypothetical protein